MKRKSWRKEVINAYLKRSSAINNHRSAQYEPERQLTMATANKTSLMISLSEGLKDAIGKEATRRDTSLAAYIREVMASAVNYDLKKDEIGTRGRKYASAEEREEAQKQRAEARRALVKQLLDEHRAKQKAQ